MKYFSMFSGIGGFELGIHNASTSWRQSESECAKLEYDPYRTFTLRKLREQIPTCVGYSEINKYAIQCYESHFKGHKNYGDATTINTAELPDFDFLCGGFPCQAFSIAGKRRGFDESRGTLFFEIARILSDKRPKHFLLENVKGLLSHDNGKTFQTIIIILTNIGYCVEWQVLNSKDFGVPQNRERVFIVGHLGVECGREVFPITGISQENNGKDCSTTVDANYFKGIDNHGQRTAIAETHKLPDAQRIREINGLSVTLKGEGGGQGAKTGLYAVPTKFLDRNQRNYQSDYSFTVDTVGTGGILKDMRIRRLTPTECERLQGFPDGWTSMLSDSQRYKCLGNAVTVNVIEAIISKLVQV